MLKTLKIQAEFLRIQVQPRKNKKLAAPVQLGRGLRGGRWPGPIIVRDGERCYRVREPWFSRSTKQGDGRFGGAGRAHRQQGLFRYILYGPVVKAVRARG